MSSRTPAALRLLALSAACLVVGAAAGLASAGSADTTRESTAKTEQVDAEQSQAFAVLRRSRTSDDTTPALVADAIRLGPEVELGANATLARRARTSASVQVYVVPARGGVCLADTSGAVSCNDTTDARAGQVATSTRTQEGLARVSGIVPDGVSQVRVRLEDGSTITAPVVDNAYVAEHRQRIVGVSFDRERVTYDVPIASP